MLFSRAEIALRSTPLRRCAIPLGKDTNPIPVCPNLLLEDMTAMVKHTFNPSTGMQRQIDLHGSRVAEEREFQTIQGYRVKLCLMHKQTKETKISYWTMLLRGTGQDSTIKDPHRSASTPIPTPPPSLCFRTWVPQAPDPAHRISSQSVHVHVWNFSLTSPNPRYLRTYQMVWHGVAIWSHKKTSWN